MTRNQIEMVIMLIDSKTIIDRRGCRIIDTNSLNELKEEIRKSGDKNNESNS